MVFADPTVCLKEQYYAEHQNANRFHRFMMDLCRFE